MDLHILRNQLQEFFDNVNLIKKTLNDDDYQQQILTPSFNRCNDLSKSIREKFQKGKFVAGQILKKQSLEIDFKRILDMYLAQCQKHKRSKQRDLEYHRQSYRKSIMKKNQQQENLRKSLSFDSDEDNNQTRIQLMQINPDILFQGQMIQQKAKQLMAINTQITNIYEIQKQIANLVNTQGKQLDIAEDNINKANSNVKDALDNMSEAKQHHKSATKKKIIIIAIVLAIVLAIFIPVGIKFF